MNIGSIYLATRSGTPGPPIAIAGPVIPRLYRCIFKTKDTNVYRGAVPEWDK